MDTVEILQIFEEIFGYAQQNDDDAGLASSKAFVV